MMKLKYREQAQELFAPSVKCIESVLLKSGAAMLEQMHTELSTRDAEIERLNDVVGTLICWLQRELGTGPAQQLLDRLKVKGDL